MSLMSIQNAQRSSIGMPRVSKSPFFAPSAPRAQVLRTPNGSTQIKDSDEEAKSSVAGAAFNLINAIVGAGIVGIPFALRECSIVLGTFMVILCALICVKSLRLLVETAKHVDVQSYERLCEASFGRAGFVIISAAMFIMSYGAMVGYLIVIKSTLPPLLGADPDDMYMKNSILTVATLVITLPLCVQRDVSNLSKTSTISVMFDCCIVAIVATFAPVSSSVEKAGGLMNIVLYSPPKLNTFFLGLGVLSFAFVCQHSAFIIAGSLERPTRARWNKVTGSALTTCAILATVMGVTGFLAFLDETDGNILNNLGAFADLSNDGSTRFASDIARGLLSTTMFFVYPIETFVARHVCVVLLFKGRRAHEGDDHSVLARTDRRVGITVALYILSLVPALLFEDLGSVFAMTGALGGSTLSYIGPGMCYLGVHGNEFLEMAAKRWTFVPQVYRIVKNNIYGDEETGGNESELNPQNDVQRKGCISRLCDSILWYLLLMPVWCAISQYGQDKIRKHEEDEAQKSPHPYRLGKVKHNKKHLRDVIPQKKTIGGNMIADNADFFQNKNVVRADSIPRRPQTFENISQTLPMTPLSLGSPKVIPPQSIVKANVAYDTTSLSEGDDEITETVSSIKSEDDGASDDKQQAKEAFEPEHLEDKNTTPSMLKPLDGSSQEKDNVMQTEYGTSSTGENLQGNLVLEPAKKIISDSSVNNEELMPLVHAQSFPKVLSQSPSSSTMTFEERKRALGFSNTSTTKPIATISTVLKEETEGDPQDDTPLLMDFIIAILLIIFGVIAAFAGLFSVFIS